MIKMTWNFQAKWSQLPLNLVENQGYSVVNVKDSLEIRTKSSVFLVIFGTFYHLNSADVV